MQDQLQLSHRQVPPLSLSPDAVHASTWLAAYPTSQLPFAQPIDFDDHHLFRRFDLRHTMGFQAQLFSDKRFNEHLGSFLSLDVCQQPRKDTEFEVPFFAMLIHSFSTPLTLLG